MDNVRRLRPDAGETHLAVGSYYYNIHDPERGRPELALARQKLPNNSKLLFSTATSSIIDGRWPGKKRYCKKGTLPSPP